MIDIQQLDYLADTIDKFGLESQDIQKQLRLRFADLRLSFCLEDELGIQQPYRCYEGFNLYLIGSSGHCLQLTEFPDQAQAVLVAQVEE